MVHYIIKVICSASPLGLFLRHNVQRLKKCPYIGSAEHAKLLRSGNLKGVIHRYFLIRRLDRRACDGFLPPVHKEFSAAHGIGKRKLFGCMERLPLMQDDLVP